MVGSFGSCPALNACGFLWSETTGTVVLTFPGTPNPQALSISDAGYIVGLEGGIDPAPGLLWIVTLTPAPMF